MAKLLICHSGQKGTFCSFINQTAFRSKQKNTGLLVFKNKFQLAFDKKETIYFILLSLCKGSFAKKSSQKTSQLKSIQQTFLHRDRVSHHCNTKYSLKMCHNLIGK